MTVRRVAQVFVQMGQVDSLDNKMLFLPYLHDELAEFITAKEGIEVFVAVVFLEHFKGVRLFDNLK